jgi:hypothetical protein
MQQKHNNSRWLYIKNYKHLIKNGIVIKNNLAGGDLRDIKRAGNILKDNQINISIFGLLSDALRRE